jgi:hypothetical protein
MHKYVILMADILFVNDLPFLITSLQDICLPTVEYLTSRTISKLASKLTRVFKIYAEAGFVIQASLLDIIRNPILANRKH